ncbi:MAG: hypothetical protein NT065_03960 [Chlamydiae bacterium]|nr:hypothetical protein [Chlamydiota bacterium]
MKIVKALLLSFLFWLISSCHPCFSLTLADKLQKSEPGDFIVTEQNKTYSLLCTVSVKDHRLILEEIAIPVSLLPSTASWKTWIADGAPGHTSWVMYEIDLQTYSLIQAYSFTRKAFIFLDESEHFLSRLIGLQLQKVSDIERKKIGPAPQSDEIDRRKIWHPTVKVNGKKTKVECDAWKTVWPKDDTLLSRCDVRLYFEKGAASIELPLWIEASNGHYTHAIKTLDSGKGLRLGGNREIPKRAPRLTLIDKMNNSIRFTIRSPSYYTQFQLYAFDIIKPYEKIGPFTHLQTYANEKETLFLDVANDKLSTHLKPGHRYKWIIIPIGSEMFTIESEDFFQWPALAAK